MMIDLVKLQEDVHDLQIRWASRRTEIVEDPALGENYYAMVMAKFTELVDILDDKIDKPEAVEDDQL